MSTRLRDGGYPCINHEDTSTKHTKERHETHEKERLETHEKERRIKMLKVTSPLSDDVERFIHDTIGCCIAVHRALGPGLFERIYSRALCIELAAAGIAFEREKRYEVTYRGQLLASQSVDFVVAGRIVLEIKSVEQVASIHHKQVLNYMRIAHLRAGLLVNFNVPVLPDGLCRKVL